LAEASTKWNGMKHSPFATLNVTGLKVNTGVGAEDFRKPS
jgi:hypothetical protein